MSVRPPSTASPASPKVPSNAAPAARRNARQASSAPSLPGSKHGRSSATLLGQADLAAALALVAAAVAAYAVLPDGSVLRVALTVPLALLLPGYLAIQAFVIREPLAERGMHALVAIGLSPAIVGLIALSTSLLPNGFQPTLIVAAVTTTCLGLAGVAGYRRVTLLNPAADPARTADAEAVSG